MNLLKQVLYPLEELARSHVVAVCKRVVKLLQELLLFAREACRDFQNEFNNVIALHVGIALVGDTLASYGDRVAGLCAFLEGVLFLAVDGGDFDLTA